MNTLDVPGQAKSWLTETMAAADVQTLGCCTRAAVTRHLGIPNMAARFAPPQGLGLAMLRDGLLMLDRRAMFGFRA